MSTTYATLSAMAFTDKASYFTWRTAWRAHYKQISQDIRFFRQHRKQRYQAQWDAHAAIVKARYGIIYSPYWYIVCEARDMMFIRTESKKKAAALRMEALRERLRDVELELPQT